MVLLLALAPVAALAQPGPAPRPALPLIDPPPRMPFVPPPTPVPRMPGRTLEPETGNVWSEGLDDRTRSHRNRAPANAARSRPGPTPTSPPALPAAPLPEMPTGRLQTEPGDAWSAVRGGRSR